MKTGKKTVNHSSVIKYYEKKGHQINTGIDTLVLALGIGDHRTQEMMSEFIKFSTITNIEYYPLEGFEGITFSSEYTTHKFGTALTVSIHHEEFESFPAFNLFLSKETRKVTMYGLLFRFCELLNIDWRVLSKEVFKHFKLSQELQSYRVIRIDYKADIFNVKPQEYYSRLKDYNKRTSPVDKRKTVKFSDQNGELETVYIGSRKSKLAYCRVYNKFVDTVNKGKQSFYHDYPDPTTRVEWQFGYKFTQGCSVDELIYKIAAYCGFDSTFTGSFYVAHRYSPDMIANVASYSDAYLKRGLKLAKNGEDTSHIHKIVELELEKYTKRTQRFISLHGLHHEPSKTGLYGFSKVL